MNAAAGLRELLDSDAKRTRLSRTERAKLRATLAALETLQRENASGPKLAGALRAFVSLAESRAACLGGLSGEMQTCLDAGREALAEAAARGVAP